MAEKSFGVKEINLIGASGTPTIESPNNLNLNAVNVAISTNVSIGGTLTVTGNVSIGGTLTYEEVTNIDSIGIITARSQLNVGNNIKLGNAGVITATSFVGDGSGLTGISGGGSGISTISNFVNIVDSLDVDGHTNLDNVSIAGVTTHKHNIAMEGNRIHFDHSGGNNNNQQIWNDGSDFRFYTTSTTGMRIQANAAGGSSSDIKLQTDSIDALVVKGTGNIEIAKDLDVDGHTNLDNVSVSGMTTHSGYLNAADRLYFDFGTGTKYMFGSGADLNTFISSGGDWKLTLNASGGTNGDFIVEKSSGTSLLEAKGTGVVDISGDLDVTGTLSATTFSGSGANLTNLPSSQLSGSLPSISGANLTNLPSPDPSDTDVQVTFDIAGNSGSGYTFTGPGNDGTTGNPDIYLIRGQRYRFINTTGSGHPFEFRNADNNADYTDGITGSQSGIQDFNVQYDAPAQLKYRCTIHTVSMVGNIYIVGSFPKISVSGQSDVVADNLADTLNLAAGSNVSITTNASTDTITISATDTNTDTNNYASSLSFSTSTGVLTVGRSGLSNLTVDLDGRYLDSSSSLSATNLTGTINNSRLPTAIDIGTSGTIKAKEFQSSGQTNRLTQAGFSVHHATGFEGLSLVKSGSGWGTAIFVNRLASSGTGNIMEIQYNGSAVGGISITTSATSFNTGSDYRLKQDITPITNALTKIKTLNPVDFKWKNNTSKFVTGFIAHEVQETGHFDETVTGVKDGMRSKYDDPETQEEDYQTVDYSKFTPMVVAALKEISDKVDALDTRLTSLENT